MNNFHNQQVRIRLLLIFLIGFIGVHTSFANPMWTAKSPMSQIQFPWIEECWNAGGDPSDINDPCMQELGGWWFGFVESLSMQGSAKVRINGEMVSFDSYPDLNNLETGESYLPGYLEVELKAGSGSEDMAALGVTLGVISYPSTFDRDMTQYGNGFCLTYESNHTVDQDFAIELGWDYDTYGYDYWTFPIPVTAGAITQDFLWEDFVQEGWDVEHPDNTLQTAITKMKTIHFRLKNTNGFATPPVTFKIHEFGMAGSCGNNTITTPPIIMSNSLPQGKAGTSYSGHLYAAGWVEEWSVSSGELPEGLSFSCLRATDCYITGTPTESGTFSFSVKAENSVDSDTKIFDIVIDYLTVNFNSQGGSAVAPATGVEYGAKIDLPIAPARTGHTFVSWFKEAAGTTAWNFDSDVVMGDVTLFAKWNVNKYTVTFDSQEGSAVSPQTINHGEKVTAPTAPTREGYTFIGWFEEATGTTVWNFETVVTVPMILYAKWEAAAPTPTIPNRANPSIGGIGVQTISNGIVLTNLPQNAKVEVYNLSGKRIHSVRAYGNTPMHITIQTKGVYIIRVNSQTHRVTIR